MTCARIDARAEFGDPHAIDEHEAALDELVGLAARAEPALGHQLGNPNLALVAGSVRSCGSVIR